MVRLNDERLAVQEAAPEHPHLDPPRAEPLDHAQHSLVGLTGERYEVPVFLHHAVVLVKRLREPDVAIVLGQMVAPQRPPAAQVLGDVGLRAEHQPDPPGPLQLVGQE